jgi:signal transduction histidine kinase
MSDASDADSTAKSSADTALYGRLERLALVTGALIMLGIVAMSVLIAQRTNTDLDEAARAQAARVLTLSVLGTVGLAESGQRGYLLTERTDYRSPYDDALARLPVLLDRLDRSMLKDPRLPRWRSLIGSKMAELGETVRLQQAGRHADALALVNTDRGRNDMIAIRAIAAGLSATESQVAASGLQRSQQGTRLLVAVDTVALIQLLALIGFVGRSLRRTVRALRLSGTALQRANLELEGGRDRLEAAVAERTAELTEANDEIQRFAYIVSHDLRAPLLNIIGFTSELENATARLNRFVAEHLEPAGIVVPQDVREASRDDLPEAIRFIQTSTAKMDRLITAILRLSREGRRVLVPERLDMAALLSGIFDSVRHVADAAGAKLSLGAVPPLVSDRLAVEQVFSNLVENALKYTAPGRPCEIVISGGQSAGMARFEVRDNGRGIAERDRERVFELFRRAGVQDTTGEGIGLAHVRTLLRRLGGTIECQSVHGSGSVFIVQLPPLLAHGTATVVKGAETV